MKNTNSDYLLAENFVSVTKGDGFRVFPFGAIYKNGVKREITPEFARTIKLPHFKPPIKLSSHDDSAPAGGFITGLEVREDGLYVIPEWNEAGLKAIQEGAYRYNSPEILWSGGLENPTDGVVISGPMLLGTALLHTPHLGESTAMYSIEKITGVSNMEENITLPKGFFEKYVAPLLSKPEPEVKTVVPEDYEATKLERDNFKAQIEKQEADKLRAGRVEKFSAELAEVKADPTLDELLADLPEEKAGAIMKQFRAYNEQVNASALLGEQGSNGGAIEDPKAAFNAIVLKYAAEKKVDYNTAFEIVKAENPDLFTAWAVVRKEK